MDQTLEGGCQCGAVRYRITGTPLFAAICHCTMCRRAHAAPAVAWAMFNDTQVSFVAGKPETYASSPEAERGFCASCGTPLSFTASFLPGLIDIAIGSLDTPEAVPPAAHIWDSKRLPWVHAAEGLPRHPGFPPAPPG